MFLEDPRYDEDNKRMIKIDFLKEEMECYKKEASKKLSNIIHPSFIHQIAKVISYSYLEENVYAKTIADKLDLDLIHFISIEEDLKVFEELYLEQRV